MWFDCTYWKHLKHSPWKRCLFPPLAATDILLSSLNGNPQDWHNSIDSDRLELRNMTDFLRDAGESFSASFLRPIVGDMLRNLCSDGGLSVLRDKVGEFVIDRVSGFSVLGGMFMGESRSATLCSYTGVCGFDQLPYCSGWMGIKDKSPGEVTGRGRRGLRRLSTNGEICFSSDWWLMLCTIPLSTLYTLPEIIQQILGVVEERETP